MMRIAFHLPLPCRGKLFLLTCFCLQLWISDFHPAQAAEIRQYCQYETLNATCNKDEVVVMETARYGRMQTGRCVGKNYGHVGCSQNVRPHLDRLCSGRQSCSLVVPGDVLHKMRPCPKDLTVYLDASFSCLKVETGGNQSCHQMGYLSLTSPRGYLSSVVAARAGLGGKDCPWVVQALPGQRINITLLDFGAAHKSYPLKNANEVVEMAPSTSCHQYAVIREHQVTRENVVCNGTERMRKVYYSASNQVQIIISKYTTLKATPHFLLMYEAIGCPTLTAPPGGWIANHHGVVVMGCNKTDTRWRLHCDGNVWVGKMSNCTLGAGEMAESIWTVIPEDWSSPMGILIVSALGIALGLVIGVGMLTVVLFVVKRKKDSCLHGETDYIEATQDSDENHGGYVMQNKQNSNTALMEQLEMMTMPDTNTYGATWRAQGPPPFTDIPQQQTPRHTSDIWRGGTPVLVSATDNSVEVQHREVNPSRILIAPGTPLHHRAAGGVGPGCPASVGCPVSPHTQGSEAFGNRITADLNVTCRVIDPHVYESPHFTIKRDHARHLLDQRERDNS